MEFEKRKKNKKRVGEVWLKNRTGIDGKYVQIWVNGCWVASVSGDEFIVYEKELEHVHLCLFNNENRTNEEFRILP